MASYAESVSMSWRRHDQMVRNPYCCRWAVIAIAQVVPDENLARYTPILDDRLLSNVLVNHEDDMNLGFLLLTGIVCTSTDFS